MHLSKALGKAAITAAAVVGMLAMPLSTQASSNKFKFDASDYNWNQLKKLDVEKHGASVLNPASLVLRVLNKCQGEPDDGSDSIENGQIKLKDDFVRLMLKPETTTTCYDTTELFTGQSLYLDQAGLDAAAARNDARVFRPGKILEAKMRFSDNYANATAKGSSGLLGQSWDIGTFTLPNGTVVNRSTWIAASFTYLPGLDFGGGFVVPAGVYAVAADLGSGYINFLPVSPLVDVSQWHDYAIKWEVGNVFTYSVDDTVLYSFTATGMRTTNLYTHAGVWVDNNDFSAGLDVNGKGVVFTEKQTLDIKKLVVKPI